MSLPTGYRICVLSGKYVTQRLKASLPPTLKEMTEAKTEGSEQVSREVLPDVKDDWNPSVTNPKRSVFLLVTHLGLAYAEVSSALQKSCRRGLAKEAVQWALDMYLSGSSAHTNTWNRSLVIAVEDVGPADPQLIWLVMFCQTQATAATATGSSGDAVYLWLATAAFLLASARKTRVNDWMMRMYRLDKGKPSIQAVDGSMETEDTLALKLGEALQKKDVGIAWYYADALFHYESKTAIRKFYNQSIFKGNTFVSDLAEIGLRTTWFKDGKHRLLLAHIINLHCTDLLPKARMSNEQAMQELVKRSVNCEDYKYMLKAVRSRDKSILLGLPDFALDMHSSRGKKMKRGLKHFIEVGSKLSNTDPYWENISQIFLKNYWKVEDSK